MCMKIIIDACAFGSVLNSDADYILRRWIGNRHCIVAYTESGTYGTELRRSNRTLQLFTEYRRNGSAELVGGDKLRAVEGSLQDKPVRSNDEHILHLPLARDALMLRTEERFQLRQDFKNLLPKISRRSRAVYPERGTDRIKRRFLDQRKCPAR